MGKLVKGPHEEITYRIIGAAMVVHRRLGPGHKEIIYQRALEAEFEKVGLAFEAQKNLEVYDLESYRSAYRPANQFWRTQLATSPCLSLAAGCRV